MNLEQRIKELEAELDAARRGWNASEEKRIDAINERDEYKRQAETCCAMNKEMHAELERLRKQVAESTRSSVSAPMTPEEEVEYLKQVIMDLLACIRCTHVDMGGNHRYHIQAGRKTVQAMYAANDAITPKTQQPL